MVSMPESEKTVYLTFDDGPDPEQTTRVLDALNKSGIKATFFVIGEKIKENREIVKRILDEGHVLGHHTYFHKPPGEVSVDQLVVEIEETDNLIVEISGKSSKLFRPPLGKLSFRKLLSLWKTGKSICLWNNDPKDFSCANLEEVLHHFNQQPIQAGDVVLLHDNQPYAADVISHLAEQAAKFNLKFGTLSALQN
jgi:peptidoglycan-N-acetylglucosamine deacetylase